MELFRELNMLLTSLAVSKHEIEMWKPLHSVSTVDITIIMQRFTRFYMTCL